MLLRRPQIKFGAKTKFLPDGNSDTVPPDSISNSEVKRISGNGSVGFPHVRVAHRQAPIRRTRPCDGFFYACRKVGLHLTAILYPLSLIHSSVILAQNHPVILAQARTSQQFCSMQKELCLRLLGNAGGPRLREDDGVMFLIRCDSSIMTIVFTKFLRTQITH